MRVFSFGIFSSIHLFSHPACSHIQFYSSAEVSQEDFMRQLGREYVRECRYQYGKALESLGYNIEGFLTNLTGVCDIIKTNPNLKTKNDVPSLVCNRQGGRVVLHFFTNREPIRYFVGGVIEGVGAQVFSRSVVVTCDKCDTPNGNRSNHRFYFRYTIEEDDCFGEDSIMTRSPESENQRMISSTNSDKGRESKLNVVGDEMSPLPLYEHPVFDDIPGNNTAQCDYQDENGLSNTNSSLQNVSKATSHNGQSSIVTALQSRASCNTKDSKIGVSSFCKAFPWHFICNKAMKIIQLGSGLLQVSK